MPSGKTSTRIAHQPFTARWVELTAPVGSLESLQAAVQGGADSVYFGIGHLNMRSRSSMNFTLDDLQPIMAVCREHGLRAYLTLNTVIYDEETELMHSIVEAAKEHGIAAIIASDLAVMRYARSRDMAVHISTQCNISNLEAVRFYAQFADVMVLARELSLGQVARIVSAVREESITGPSGEPVKIEIFAHGALCMAISGKCYLSQDLYGQSANRGACYQVCRRNFIAKDAEEGFEIEVDQPYFFSPKDLKTIDFLDKILEAGVSVLKVEGRGRAPDYVKTVLRCYREAVDAYFDGTFSPEKVRDWNERLSAVYNRGFWDGYYLGKKGMEWSSRYGSQATTRKVYVGKVTNFFRKIGVAEVLIETNSIATGDRICVIGPTTGVHEDDVKEIRTDLEVRDSAVKGDLCSIPLTGLVRRGDKLYRIDPVAETP